jgi:uncharacterized protein (DUF427 family)
MEYFLQTGHHTVCEFKGAASYWTIRISRRVVENAAWSYPTPSPGYEVLKNHLAFYASKMDACYVDDEQVKPQEARLYPITDS